jgi:hypothetical protein
MARPCSDDLHAWVVAAVAVEGLRARGGTPLQMSLSDRIVVMNHGRVVQMGTARDLCAGSVRVPRVAFRR